MRDSPTAGCGSDGIIGGHPVADFRQRGFIRIRSVDRNLMKERVVAAKSWQGKPSSTPEACRT